MALRFLRSVLGRGRIPNALLFWGPDGVGKRLTALELAKALVCKDIEDGKGEACDLCLACRKVGTGNHPDVRMIVPARKSRLIDLDTITEVTATASLRPHESSWRVFIIQDADRLTIPAQNRFLKTLEEPPGNSLFILTSAYPRVLLPTIRSRCQPVRFRTLQTETVVELLLERREVPDQTALSIAALAQGQMSRALDLVDSGRRESVLDMIGRLAEGDDPVILAEEFVKVLADQRQRVHEAVEAGLPPDEAAAMSPEERERLKEEQLALVDALCKRDILEHLYLFETWYRDQLVFGATHVPDQVLNQDQMDRLQSEPVSAPDEKITAIERARTHLDRFIAEERVFVNLFLALAAP